MEARDASIFVSEADFNRSITMHMSTVVLCHFATDEMFEPPRVAIDVRIDGYTHDFALLHMVTDYWNISAMVLTNTVMAARPDAQNTLEYVLVKVSSGEFDVVQKVFQLEERIAISNPGRTIMDLLARLYSG